MVEINTYLEEIPDVCLDFSVTSRLLSSISWGFDAIVIRMVKNNVHGSFTELIRRHQLFEDCYQIAAQDNYQLNGLIIDVVYFKLF